MIAPALSPNAERELLMNSTRQHLYRLGLQAARSIKGDEGE